MYKRQGQDNPALYIMTDKLSRNIQSLLLDLQYRSFAAPTAFDLSLIHIFFQVYSKSSKTAAELYELKAIEQKQELDNTYMPVSYTHLDVYKRQSVHCVWTLKELGYEVILINNNPETFSTDFDTGDRLYFEPLTPEDVMNVIKVEKPVGVVVAFGLSLIHI